MTEEKNGKSQFDVALDELRAVLAGVNENMVDAACGMLAGAGRIAVFAGGREGLQMKGLAMRMFHLGMPVSVVGDMTTPPLGRGDVFFACSGPGETTTVVTLLEVARAAGARNLVLTAQPGSSVARLADFMLLMPAQTMADDQGEKRSSVLPMGSVFEGAMFVLFEVMVLKLKELLGVSAEEMRARHTNME
jgi:6-phospho-3-hexuloisomerase